MEQWFSSSHIPVVVRSTSVVARIGHHLSRTPARLQCGVLQGSVLGPVLFIMYAVHFLALIEQRGFARISTRSDDAQVYGSSRPSATSDLQERLSTCIDDVHDWMQSNRLQLNTNETELFCCASARRQYQLPPSALRIGTDAIIPRRRRCVTSEATLTLTSACGLTFGRLSLVALRFASTEQYPTISSNVYFSDSGCCSCTVDVGLRPCYTYSVARSPCSTLQLDQSPVSAVLLTSKTLLPVSTGRMLRTN